MSIGSHGFRGFSLAFVAVSLLIAPLYPIASGEPTDSGPAAPVVTSFAPSEGSASGGTQITFTGTNLDDVTEVTFGDQAATDPDVNDSGTELTVTSPAREGDATEVAITLRTTDRDVVLDSFFTYLDDFSAETTITGMSPASGPTSGGQVVTVTGSNLDDVTNVTFGDQAATDLTINGDGTELRVTTPSGDAGSVTVTFALTDDTTVTFGPYEFLPEPVALALPGEPGPLTRPVLPNTSLIVKYKPGVPVQQAGQITGQEAVPTVQLEDPFASGGGTTVVSLDEPVSPDEAKVLADALEADPRVEWAEPNSWAFPTTYPATPPNDADYDKLWGLWDTYGVRVGSNVTTMTPAWSTSRGTGITVAVLDTGQITHPDLGANTVTGYDFVSGSVPTSGSCGGAAVELIRSTGMSLSNSNSDGDVLNTSIYGAVGRDAIPLDPGDWGRQYFCNPAPDTNVYYQFRQSSWHGTHVAGTIGAVTNNAVGIAGVAPDVKLVPVRVLGYGGGTTADIADGIRWAAGIPVPGAPTNENPAKIINMSLGGTGSCNDASQNAINAARAAGSIVVVAAGNEDQDVAKVSPASCAGVISVAATNQAGNRASYSNFGAGITIAAPGGVGLGDSGNQIFSTLSSIQTGPGYTVQDPAGPADLVPTTTLPTPSYGFSSGTSMASPHVAGVVALMLSASGGPTTEAQVRTLLERTAQPFAGDTVCDPVTSSKTCGWGIVNAAAITAPQVSSVNPLMSLTAGGGAAVITGSTLTDVTDVRFGASAAIFTVDSSTQITATIPTGATGTVNVTVRSASGRSNRITFRYEDPAPPDPGPGPAPAPDPVPAPTIPPDASPLPDPDPSPVKPTDPVLPPANAVTPDEVRALSPAQVATLPPAYVSQLPPSAFSAFSPAQVAAMTPQQVAAIRPARAAQLRPAAVRAMNVEQLTVLRPGSVGRLRPAAIRLLDGDQLVAIRPAAYGRMQPSQTARLRPNQMPQIRPVSVRSLNPRAVAAIPAQTISRMTATQIRSLTPAQTRVLTPAQRRALNRA